MTSLMKIFHHIIKPQPGAFPLLLIGYCVTMLFKPSHWSPGHMAHYNLPLANYHSRICIALHTFVMSRSLAKLHKPCSIFFEKYFLLMYCTVYVF